MIGVLSKLVKIVLGIEEGVNIFVWGIERIYEKGKKWIEFWWMERRKFNGKKMLEEKEYSKNIYSLFILSKCCVSIIENY